MPITNGIGTLINWLERYRDDETKALPDVPEPIARRLYSAIAITLRSPSEYEEYLRRLASVIEQGRYLTRGERILQLEPDAPAQRLNVVYYDTPQVRDALRADRTFQNILVLRDRGVHMAGVDGFAVAGDFSETESATRRVYAVDFIRFRHAQAIGQFRDWLQRFGEMLVHYGYHIERAICPTATIGGVEAPHLVNVTYFETEEHHQAFVADRRHGDLERQWSEIIAWHTRYRGTSVN